MHEKHHFARTGHERFVDFAFGAPYLLARAKWPRANKSKSQCVLTLCHSLSTSYRLGRKNAYRGADLNTWAEANRVDAQTRLAVHASATPHFRPNPHRPGAILHNSWATTAEFLQVRPSCLRAITDMGCGQATQEQKGCRTDI